MEDMAKNGINTLYKKWRETEDPARESYDPPAAHDALAEMLPQVEGYVDRVAKALFKGDSPVAWNVRQETVDATGEILDAALRKAKASDPGIEKWQTFSSFLSGQIQSMVGARYAYHSREGRGGPGLDARRKGEGKAWIGTQSLDDETSDGFRYAETITTSGLSPLDGSAAAELKERLADRLRGYVVESQDYDRRVENLIARHAHAMGHTLEQIGGKLRADGGLSKEGVNQKIQGVDRAVEPVIRQYLEEGGELRQAGPALTEALARVIKEQGGRPFSGPGSFRLRGRPARPGSFGEAVAAGVSGNGHGNGR